MTEQQSSALLAADTYAAPGYDTLKAHVPIVSPSEQLLFTPNSSYEQYLKMHKVLVGSATAGDLLQMHDRLAREEMPRYLTAAGWAATEAALVDTEAPTLERLAHIDQGVAAWERALSNQLDLNQTGKDYLTEYAAPYRTALDIAVSPLLKGVVAGDLTDLTCMNVFEDCLNIAEANMVQLRLAAKAGNTDAIGEHVGLGYECNALLALNRLQSKTWFAVPALARSDTGYHHSEQTHDLLVIRQKRGDIKSIIPVEVKASAGARDRARYQALLVRGKMHLSVEGQYAPEKTLAAIAAVYSGSHSVKEEQIASQVSSRFMDMLSDYYAGHCLGKVAINRTTPHFRDNAKVVARHPGLSVMAS